MEAYKREFIQFLEGAGVLKFGDFTAKTNFTVKIGDVTSDIKVIVELTAPGRASTLYVPVMILA